MLWKQLLTMACAVGILACGACFLPPRYTPQPPPAIFSENVKRLRIVVVNQTESRHLDPSALAEVLAGKIDIFAAGAHVSSHIDGALNSAEDSVLQVQILSESAELQSSPSRNGLALWKFQIKTSASLTNASGIPLWRGKEFLNLDVSPSYATDAETMWKDPLAQSDLLRRLGIELASRVIHQAPSDTAQGRDTPPTH